MLPANPLPRQVLLRIGQSMLKSLLLSSALIAVPAWAKAAELAPEVAPMPASIGQPIGQNANRDDDAGADGAKTPEIVVVATGAKIPGMVDAPQVPIVTMNEQDISAYGAKSIAELVAAVAPQAGSGRGRGGGGMPVILINGQRISSFREMRDFPPESIKKLEILPEEVALRYGYSADQRVMNFILKDHYRRNGVEVEYAAPDRGGTATLTLEATMLRIDKNKRLNITFANEHKSLLTEAERGVLQSAGSLSAVANDPNMASNRSLLGNRFNNSLNVTRTLGLGKDGMAGTFTLNGTISRADNTSLSGLNAVTLIAPSGASALRTLPGALMRFNRTDTMQGGAGLNTRFGDWQFSATLDASHISSSNRTDNRANTTSLTAAALAGTLPILGALPALPNAGFSTARSYSDSVTSLVTLVGHPFHMPAGDVALTVKAGFAYTAQTSDDSRVLTGPSRLRRGDGSVGMNLAMPITSRRSGVGAALGDISLNFSAGADRFSDFDWLSNWSAGVTWGITKKFGLQASYLSSKSAPSLSSLNSPQTTSFNVPIYDFTNGQTVLASITSGGNPLLAAQQRHDIKLGLNWQLPFMAKANQSSSNLVVEYFSNESNNITIGFPLLTPAIEAAYPTRVTRNGAGQITAIDQRPVMLAMQKEERLRWGLNFMGTLGKPVVGGRGGFGGGVGRPAGAGGGRPPAGGMMGGPGGQFAGRWNLSLFHTIQFTDQVQLAPGAAFLDLLNGDALASNGGVAKHAVEFEGGLFYKGKGFRLNGNWFTPTRVNTSGADLRFGSVFKLNLRLFVDMDQQKSWVKSLPFLTGGRFSIMANNILDSRQKVTDAFGATPLSYQADYLDPMGRVLGIEFRKSF
ncbi:MAG: hypothetical protein RLY97_195 [Pseudomonadota bacterium]